MLMETLEIKSQHQARLFSGIYRINPVRILTIGDGDLSFTLNLAKSVPKCRVIGTTYLTNAEFKNVYGDSDSTLRATSMISNLQILHGVDATLLGKKKSPLYNMSENLYHKIIWHFPVCRLKIIVQ